MTENWVASTESLRSTALVHSNSWDAQLAVPNDPRYARLETNLGIGMSWTYRWAVMVPLIYTKGDHILYAITPHTIASAVGVMCRCKVKVGLRRSPRGLHTRTQLSSLLRLDLDSRVDKDDLVPFRCSPVSMCAAPLQMEASMDERHGKHT
ncbi:hypothetical protein TNCV_2077231 [Trichonephila clavipes]|nr:hypothetical protein TNCV_2077231 [Trichonephila clavipes]